MKRKENRSPYLVERPRGGYTLVPAWLLLAVWSAYAEGRVSLLGLRVWFALRETLERRRAYVLGLRKEGKPPREGLKARYALEEIEHLLGGGGGARAALEELRSARLVQLSEDRLAFPREVASLQLTASQRERFEATLALVENHQRKVPMPREVLALLAKEGTRTLIATTLGYLLRALYFRGGTCKSGGAVKAAWIAEVFQVSLRGAHEARARLFSLGLLFPVKKPTWYEKRYGQWAVLRLYWRHRRSEREEARSLAQAPERQAAGPFCGCSGEGQVAPQKIPAGVGALPGGNSAGLRNTGNSPSEKKHQKPASADAGVCKQGAGKNAEEPGERSAPKRRALSQAHSGGKLFTLEREDLRDPKRFGALQGELERRGWIRPGQEREAWECRAHALSKGKDPVRLFVSLLKRPEIRRFISGEDEREAGLSMQAFLRAEAPPALLTLGGAQAPKPTRIDPEVELVWRVRRALGRVGGMTEENLAQVLRKLPGWDLERWREAERKERALKAESHRAYA